MPEWVTHLIAVIVGGGLTFGTQAFIEWRRRSNERELFIHRLQFEKEFMGYQQLWEKVFEINRRISESSYTGADSGLLGQLKDYIGNIRPFISSEVYEKALEVVSHKFDMDMYIQMDKGRLPPNPISS